jgi:cyclic dehypoxanthinyl futalosine synthase
VTQGPKVGQVTLWHGANDMGSTMMEENVVSQAGCVHHWDARGIELAIRRAGFEPRRRDFLLSLAARGEALDENREMRFPRRPSVN